MTKLELEIWLAPRFMIKKKRETSAKHLQPILDNWTEETAPIGILWIWGGWENLSWYDHLTNVSTDNISSKNLYENWQRPESVRTHPIAHGLSAMETCELAERRSRKISCSFVNQNKDY